ncbi:MAG: hypothetical protein Q4G66_00275 [bacterium]|nr:hypothetical protein [bacterium]
MLNLTWGWFKQLKPRCGDFADPFLRAELVALNGQLILFITQNDRAALYLLPFVLHRNNLGM